MHSFKLGRHEIGKERNDYCFIIAEAGSNHDQKRTNALELVDAAAEAGVDAVKFQLYCAEKMYSKFASKAILEEIRNTQLPIDFLPDVLDRCKSQKIMFLASPFDYDAVDYLDSIDVPAYKLASGEITDTDLISYAARRKKPMILSTGMCNLADIELAVDSITGQNNSKIALLHCVSAYPTQPTDVNLRIMQTLERVFDYPVGYSDHTLGLSVALAAVALGARILEKHFTLDKKLSTPDHHFALRPKELKSLVNGVREVNQSMGSSVKRMREVERDFAKNGKRSLVAKRGIKKGTAVSRTMLTAKRPGTGIEVKLAPFVVNRIAKVDIERDQILSWNMLV